MQWSAGLERARRKGLAAGEEELLREYRAWERRPLDRRRSAARECRPAGVADRSGAAQKRARELESAMASPPCGQGGWQRGTAGALAKPEARSTSGA